MYIRIFKEVTKIINIHVHFDNKLLLFVRGPNDVIVFYLCRV